jgi:hypothetical protein
MEIRRPTKNVHKILGTGFSVEMRMATKNVLIGTGFGMEIRMPTKNI